MYTNYAHVHFSITHSLYICVVHTSDLGMEKMAASTSGGATSEVGLRRCFLVVPGSSVVFGGGEEPSLLDFGLPSPSAPLLILSSSLLFMYFLP